MVAVLIDGKARADRLLTEVSAFVKTLKAPPRLDLIVIGDNPASHIYVRNKKQACERVGIISHIHHLDASTPQSHVMDVIHGLNNQKQTHGILVQMPLPTGFDRNALLESIAPLKDVDGFHPINSGRLMRGDSSGLFPCTPLGVMDLLIHTLGGDGQHYPLSGLHAVVVGRSDIVGRPTAQLLEKQNCTVTLCHSHTRNLASYVGQADILVAAIGKPKFIPGDWIKKGACVIDVGLSSVGIKNGKSILVGDVDSRSALSRAAYITPVPGGVGPMTIAYLLKNTCRAHQLQAAA